MIEMTADLLEPNFDTLLSSGVVKEIPILGSLVKAAQIGSTISDKIFAAKLTRMINCLGSLDDEEITRTIWEIKKDDDLRNRVGTALVLIVDRIDEIDKSDLVARVFRAYLRKRIKLEDFRRMCLAINTAFLDDLRDFLALSKPSSAGSRDLIRRLIGAGLGETSGTAVGFATSFSTVNILVSDLGKMFWETIRAN